MPAVRASAGNRAGDVASCVAKSWSSRASPLDFGRSQCESFAWPVIKRLANHVLSTAMQIGRVPLFDYMHACMWPEHEVLEIVLEPICLRMVRDISVDGRQR